MGYCIVIPARYDSSRLPGKPLRDIQGKPLIRHVYECATKSRADKVIIATDDQRIFDTAVNFGANVCMTGTQHTSGTERIAEVIEKEGFSDDTIIVNLQGDEPLMPAACLDQVADLLENSTDCVMATLCEPIHAVDDIFDPDIVKVVFNGQGHALYFSRAPIPWHRNSFAKDRTQITLSGEDNYRHIGLYAYTARYVREYLAAEPCPLEKIESLEQLRVLWHGKKIAIGVAVSPPGPGVDTEQDLARVRRLFEQGKNNMPGIHLA
ncbi:MAG: 3-deoxy-manno-octulosonate cytidylyltransferase [Gammaproteobacteria bacterium]|nr:3-deoxy-manno-octulosonate cytidylyltransferase [Gammaproteobacteria bacterium]MDH5652662.1 3-deoxy-manno-octulosonate cytidylyltransferase [Gammaproteobacteria bacterium]